MGLLLGLVLLGACHTYAPVQTPTLGSTVRVRVPVRSAIENSNAQPGSATVEGVVLQNGDTIYLAIESRQDLGGFRGEYLQRDTVRISRNDISGIDVQEFSSGRSVLLGVTIAGAATAFALTALGIEGGEAGEGTPGDGSNPEGALIPVRRINFAPFVSAVFGLLGR